MGTAASTRPGMNFSGWLRTLAGGVNRFWRPIASDTDTVLGFSYPNLALYVSPVFSTHVTKTSTVRAGGSGGEEHFPANPASASASLVTGTALADTCGVVSCQRIVSPRPPVTENADSTLPGWNEEGCSLATPPVT